MMAVMPEMVNTRKLEILRDYLDDMGAVIEVGYEYFEVLADPDTLTKPSNPNVRIVQMMVADEVPRTRVYWLDKDRRRVKEAIEGDLAETLRNTPQEGSTQAAQVIPNGERGEFRLTDAMMFEAGAVTLAAFEVLLREEAYARNLDLQLLEEPESHSVVVRWRPGDAPKKGTTRM